MIDTLSILFSLFAVGFVVVRAVILDRKLPWFVPPTPGAAPADPGRGLGRRRQPRR